MAKDLEQKEIRSAKVRNIMIEEPPLLVRYGTVIIATLLLIVVVIAYLIL